MLICSLGLVREFLPLILLLLIRQGAKLLMRLTKVSLISAQELLSTTLLTIIALPRW